MCANKILIADDETDLSYMLKLALTQMGDYEIEQAITGQEAIEKALSFNPDLIIMDYRMPGMNGWVATKNIKANPKTAHIIIVGYTAYASVENVKEGIKAGLAEIITKPIDIIKWQQRLTKYFGKN